MEEQKSTAVQPKAPLPELQDTGITDDKKQPYLPEKPYKMTPEVIAKLKEAFAYDASVQEACYYAEISADSYYRWIKKWPKLAEQFERLRQKPILKARQTIVKALDDPIFAFKYMERKRKKEFSTRHELTDGDGKPLQSNTITFVNFENEPASE